MEDRFEMPPGDDVAVALFAGSGGSSKGLHDAGFQLVGFEYSSSAVATHRANGMRCYTHDLSLSLMDELIPVASLLWASPPCQPFSAAGDGEGEFDDRDGFPWTLRIIAKRLPAVAIIENVKGLTFAKHHAYFAGILTSLRELGYEVDWRVLNSADYGVPQTRERCFIICRRDGGRIVWPAPTHTERAGMFSERWIAMADALGWYDPHVVINYRQTNRNGEPIYCNATDRPAPTIGTQSRSQWIVNGTQKLTAEETALLQGFPADYVWCGNVGDVDRQIGNAVPPAMAQALAEANRPVRAEVAT